LWTEASVALTRTKNALPNYLWRRLVPKSGSRGRVAKLPRVGTLHECRVMRRWRFLYENSGQRHRQLSTSRHGCGSGSAPPRLLRIRGAGHRPSSGRAWLRIREALQRQLLGSAQGPGSVAPRSRPCPALEDVPSPSSAKGRTRAGLVICQRARSHREGGTSAAGGGSGGGGGGGVMAHFERSSVVATVSRSTSATISSYLTASCNGTKARSHLVRQV
jgi:hypothetical protein